MAGKSWEQIDTEAISKYLQSNNIYLSYVPYKKGPSKNYLQRKSLLILIAFTLVNLKNLPLLVVDADSPWAIFLVDPNISTGVARQPLNSIFSFWTFATFVVLVYLRYTQYSRKRQTWTRVARILACEDINELRSSPKLVGLLFNVTDFLRGYGIILGIISGIPYILSAGTLEDALLRIFGLPVLVFTASVVISYGINFPVLFFLTINSYGRYFDRQAHEIRTKKDFGWIDMENRVEKVLKIYVEMLETYMFFELINVMSFSSTFFSQIFMLYFFFFGDIPIAFRVIFSVNLLLNYCCGQSAHFFVGGYTKRKVHSCLDAMLSKLVKLEMSPGSRIRMLNILEYSRSRKLFTIFGALEYSSVNALKCVLESASFLLMMIANQASRNNG